MGRWTVTEESVQQYLKAVGDSLPLYRQTGLAPPLALVAYALGAILQKLALPPGSIHSLQELEAHRPVRFGQEVWGIARLSRPKVRAGMQFVTVGYALQDSDNETLLTGKTTVLVPEGFSLVAPE